VSAGELKLLAALALQEVPNHMLQYEIVFSKAYNLSLIFQLVIRGATEIFQGPGYLHK